MRGEEAISLDGRSLSLRDIENVALRGVRVSLNVVARANMGRSRGLKARLIGSGQPIYGVTTGFGDSADRQISGARASELQVNLIQYHLNGTGPDAPREVVRAMMVIRANCLARGVSAISPELVERIVEMLNADVVPRVPVRGSVGASGGLVPLCYLGNAVAGEGMVDYKGQLVSMREVMKEQGWAELPFEAKDGLALINGTSFSCALGVLAVRDARRVGALATIATALASEALLGNRGHFAAFLSECKPHPGQSAVAAALFRMLSDSRLAMDHRGLFRNGHPCSITPCQRQVRGICE